MNAETLFGKYALQDPEPVRIALEEELARTKDKIVVLDDDPTGIQTIHDLYVYTDWSRESFREGFADSRRAFFIMTNSRSFSEEVTEAVHREVAGNLLAESRRFILVSRGDSTLRGHYPLETRVLRDALESGGLPVDGEIIYPFFPEGGRYTAGNIHYARVGDEMIPVGETEFAKDKAFGYHSSDLAAWVEEKTCGAYRAADVVCVTMEDLRSLDYDGIEKKLLSVRNFGKVIVNSLSYDDARVFVTAFLRAAAKGKRFIFRSAAAAVKILAGVTDKPLLDKELKSPGNPHGGLIVVGSHVRKTTAQLEALRAREDIAFVEFNQHLVLEPEKLDAETERVLAEVTEKISGGKTVAMYTRRERFDVNSGDKEDELRCAAAISEKITSVVGRLPVRPAFIIAKGGITSSDIGTKGLSVKKALALGQILPGVPVWLTGPESRFPDLAYVIFPGNVGDEDSLLRAVEKFD